jgi:hypothetical protein
MGRRGGVQEKKEGGVARKGKKGAHRFFCERKETTPQITSDLASNGSQPFSHIHAPKINFWSFFGDITSSRAQIFTMGSPTLVCWCSSL